MTLRSLADHMNDRPIRWLRCRDHWKRYGWIRSQRLLARSGEEVIDLGVW